MGFKKSEKKNLYNLQTSNWRPNGLKNQSKFLLILFSAVHMTKIVMVETA